MHRNQSWMGLRQAPHASLAAMAAILVASSSARVGFFAMSTPPSKQGSDVAAELALEQGVPGHRARHSLVQVEQPLTRVMVAAQKLRLQPRLRHRVEHRRQPFARAEQPSEGVASCAVAMAKGPAAARTQIARAWSRIFMVPPDKSQNGQLGLSLEPRMPRIGAGALKVPKADEIAGKCPVSGAEMGAA